MSAPILCCVIVVLILIVVLYPNKEKFNFGQEQMMFKGDPSFAQMMFDDGNPYDRPPYMYNANSQNSNPSVMIDCLANCAVDQYNGCTTSKCCQNYCNSVNY